MIHDIFADIFNGQNIKIGRCGIAPEGMIVTEKTEVEIPSCHCGRFLFGRKNLLSAMIPPCLEVSF